MLVTGFPAGSFQTNCWLVATGPGSEALVVDPGQDALPGIAELCARHRLEPVAALLTHGHLDHLWTVAPLAGASGIPAFVHPADRHLLTDPLAGFAPEARAAFGWLRLQEPDDVRELADGQTIELAGLRVTVDHTPGHKPGHVTFRLPPVNRPEGSGEPQRGAPVNRPEGSGEPQRGAPVNRPEGSGEPQRGAPVNRPEGSGEPQQGAPGSEPPRLLAGDLVFAGSIGRTDLPGGSMREMLASLTTRFLTLPDETVVLPGHGPETTVGRERAYNPFLADLVAGSQVERGAGR